MLKKVYFIVIVIIFIYLCEDSVYAQNVDKSTKEFITREDTLEENVLKDNASKERILEENRLKDNASKEKTLEDNVLKEDVSEELLEGLDFDNLQDLMDEQIGEGNFNFYEKVKNLMEKGDVGIEKYIEVVFDGIKNNIEEKRTLIIRLIVLAVTSAVFTNFAKSFLSSSISDTGFIIVYLMLFTVLISTFMAVMEIAESVVNLVLAFTSVLAPIYGATIIFASGSAKGVLFSEAIIIVMGLVEVLYLKVLMPLISTYVTIVFANNIVKEDLLSKMANLIKTLVRWINRTSLLTIVGFQTIQKLGLASADDTKRKMLMNAVSTIPAIGRTFSIIGESVYNAGGVLMSATGVIGILSIIVICLIPIINIVIYVFTYSFTAAAVQPVADKRIVGCISGVEDGAKMLLEITFGAIALFIFSIAIVIGE